MALIRQRSVSVPLAFGWLAFWTRVELAVFEMPLNAQRSIGVMFASGRIMGDMFHLGKHGQARPPTAVSRQGLDPRPPGGFASGGDIVQPVTGVYQFAS